MQYYCINKICVQKM